MPPAVTLASESPSGRDGSDKRPGAFRTIGEVADDLDVPQHVLRFWEGRFAQVRPVKRAGGRRYYRPDDVDLLKGIRRLLHGQGYTIRGAQRVLKENGIRFVQAVGRGEAEAGAPSLLEREPDGGAGEGAGADKASLSLAAGDRAELEDVLRDLRACRAVLAGLGPDRLED